MTVKKIMHKPTFVDPNTTVTDAAKIMAKKNISSVIVGTAEKPIGMFTERDIARKVIANGLESSDTKIKDAMTQAVFTVNVNAKVEDAIGTMMAHYIRHLPVANDNGEVVGMLSARTLIDGIRYWYL
ncbi:MAG: CBS domain-containing protein [Candidatus Hydrothermarchaeales archaeon]